MNLIIMLHLLLPELELARLYKIVHISGSVRSSLTVIVAIIVILVVAVAIIVVVFFLVSAIVAALKWA